jgi:hypothetical protein
MLASIKLSSSPKARCFPESVLKDLFLQTMLFGDFRVNFMIS